jgi:Holliday junction resolvase
MTESDFWLQCKANLPGHMVRIENVAGIGTPDVNACHNGVECWLELKVAKGHQIYFRSAQIVFMTRRVAEGGRVFVLVRYDKILLVLTGKELVSISDRLETVKKGVQKLHISKIRESFMFTQWEDVADLIYAK